LFGLLTAKDRLSGKLAVIQNADAAGSMKGVEDEELTRLDGSPDQHVRGIISCLGATAGLAVPWAAHVG
jgi:hypothetical protein